MSKDMALSSVNGIIDLFENYLKNDLKRHKTKIKQIERQLNLIESYKLYKNGVQNFGTFSDLSAIGIDKSLLNRKNKPSNDPEFSGNHSNDADNGRQPKSSLDCELSLRKARQLYICVEEEDSKPNTIYQLFRDEDIKNAIIYCKSLENVENLTELMTAEGFNVENMIGKNAKQKRELIEDMNVDALITVRRIDSLRNILVYIHFDLPTRDSYLKKSGSRERGCDEYRVISIVTKDQKNKIANYEKYLETRIQPFPNFKTSSSTESLQE